MHNHVKCETQKKYSPGTAENYDGSDQILQTSITVQDIVYYGAQGTKTIHSSSHSSAVLILNKIELVYSENLS